MCVCASLCVCVCVCVYVCVCVCVAASASASASASALCLCLCLCLCVPVRACVRACVRVHTKPQTLDHGKMLLPTRRARWSILLQPLQRAVGRGEEACASSAEGAPGCSVQNAVLTCADAARAHYFLRITVSSDRV